MTAILWVKNRLRMDGNLLKNFIALALLQATNFIIPLITFPYIVRVIGLEKFGVISYGLTILTYLMTITDYGFSLSATRLISLYRSNSIELSRIFVEVMITKLLLFLFCIFGMGIICIIVPRIKHESFSYMLGLLYVLGNAIMPVWFFQGLEKMKYITYANLIAKVLQLGLLFICVRHMQDYIYVLGLYGVANVTSGLYSMHLAISQHNLKLYLPSLASIWLQLRNGWYFFSSNLAISVANTATMIVLGFFVSNTEIGYYSIAERVIFVAWIILGLFSQAIFPSVCKLAQRPFLHMFKFLKRVTLPLIGVTGLACLFIYIFSEEIVQLIMGHYEVQAAHLLRILIIVPFIVALNIPAYQILLAYDYKKAYAALFNGSALINICMCIGLVYIWGTVGAAICMIIIQTLITLSLYLLLVVKWKESSGFTNF